MSPTAAPAAPAIWFLQNLAIPHVTSEQTGGAYCVVEMVCPPGDQPPLHVHDHDETFFVLEGALRVHAGGEVVVAGPGQPAHGPRGVPHTYVAEGEGPTRALVVSNGPFDRFVAAAGVPAEALELPSDPPPPDPERLAALAAEHGVTILGPPGALPS